MDKNKKIMIGAIGAAVVAGGVAIGLIVSRTSQGRSFHLPHGGIHQSAHRDRGETTGNDGF